MADKLLPVILVDDENLARSHVRASVEWNSLGLIVAGEASDGHEAVDLARRVNPAVAVVDINMPAMDGIAVSDWLRTEQPECKVVILSGFNEFEYAKRALHAGVLEYVLKPLRAEELTAALVRAKETYVAGVAQRHYIESLENSVEIYAERRQDSAFASLISMRDGYSDIDLESVIEIGPDSRIVVAAIDDSEELWRSIPEQNRWHGAIRDMIIERIGNDRRPVILGPDGLPVFLAGSLNDAVDVVGDIKKSIGSRFRFTISVGISRITTDRVSVYPAYREALEVLGNRFFLGPDQLLVAPMEKRTHKVIVGSKKDVLLPLRLGNLDEINDYIDRSVAAIRDEHLDKESVDLMVMEMTAAAAQFLGELDCDLDALLDEGGRPWRSVAKNIQSLDALRLWLTSVFESVLARAREDTRFKTYQVVDRAIEFIKEQYRDKQLNLRTIADSVNVNPTYLSKVFKLQTGSSVIEFLRETRLLEARDIFIRSPRSMVFEVAEEVGFSDPLYFSKVFKSRFGKSPKKFRK